MTKRWGFPSNRAELYREGVEALLKKWDASRRVKRDDLYKNLSLKRRENMLGRIAAQTFAANEYFLPKQKLKKYIAAFIDNLPDVKQAQVEIDSEAVLKSIEIQHGFFVERAKDIYSFSHLTFQEYFAASRMVETGAPADALISNYDKDKRWREVILLTSGLLPDADGFFRGMRTWIRQLERRHGIDRPLRKIAALAARVGGPDLNVQRGLLMVYWIRHVGVVRQSELTSCLQHLCDVVAVIEKAKQGIQNVEAYLARTTDVARRVGFADALARDEDLWLSSALSKSRKTARRMVEQRFPEQAMHKWADAVHLLFDCLASDCYVSRELRADIMTNAFVPGPPGPSDATK